MKITREVSYALRIVLMLAREQRQIEAKVIAEGNGIPYRFTLKILRKIVQSGIARSYRGVNGGYILNRAPSEVSMLDVMECIDGSTIDLDRCAAAGQDAGSGAYAVNMCLREVQDKLKMELTNLTFDKIMARSDI